jgi:hypothetical protein
MPQSGTFGRRGGFAPQTPTGIKRAENLSPPPGLAPPIVENIEPAPSIDDELRAWKQERRQHAPFRIPWRQLSLMASLCFFIASFVLPESVNDDVDWLLYILAAMSLWVWFSGRRRRAANTSPGASNSSSI